MKKLLSLVLFCLMIIPLSSFAPENDARVTSREKNWFPCPKCFAVFYGGRTTQGVCPGGGEHWRNSEGEGLVLNMSDCSDCYGDNCSNQFYFCKNCSCLFYTPDKSKSAACPSGGKHAAENWDFKYSICKVRGGGKPNFKDDCGHQECRWGGAFLCKKCHCLMDPGGASAPCAGGGNHDLNKSMEFVLLASGGPCKF